MKIFVTSIVLLFIAVLVGRLCGLYDTFVGGGHGGMGGGHGGMGGGHGGMGGGHGGFGGHHGGGHYGGGHYGYYGGNGYYSGGYSGGGYPWWPFLYCYDEFGNNICWPRYYV